MYMLRLMDRHSYMLTTSIFRFPFKVYINMLINRNISMYFWTQIFSKASQSSYLHTQMYSHKLKSTFSYSLHQNTPTYEQTYTNEQLHTTKEMCYICVLSSLLHIYSHTHTHTHTTLCSQSRTHTFSRYSILTKNIILICLQMNMLILAMKFTH